jgi:hypothetical protein
LLLRLSELQEKLNLRSVRAMRDQRVCVQACVSVQVFVRVSARALACLRARVRACT